jgi:hypothetical protein
MKYSVSYHYPYEWAHHSTYPMPDAQHEDTAEITVEADNPEDARRTFEERYGLDAGSVKPVE